MKLKYILSLIVISFLVFQNVSAQGDVITVDQFKELKKNTENLVVIDASKPSLYNKAHLKGAINIPYEALNEPETDDNVFGMMLSVEKLATFLGSKGVSEKDMIVVYDEGTQKYSTRVYWVLKYLGVPNVKLMHKENTKWRKARMKLTSAPTKLEAKIFIPKLDISMYTTIDDMENIDATKVVLIDARSEKEFTGANPDNSVGHLPNSIHIDYKMVLQEDKSFKAVSDLEVLMAENKVTKDKKIVVYCNSGIKAAVVLVALKEYLDFQDVTVYDGGYLEWEAFEMPMEK